jgi:hypothetical protein
LFLEAFVITDQRGYLLSVKAGVFTEGLWVFAETGSPWQTIVNSVSIVVKYLIRADNGTVLAYVDGSHFLEDDIDIKDAADGSVIANLYRDRFTLSAWTWKLTAYQPSHAVANPVLLALLAGQRSFGENSNDSDVCNTYFVDVGWVLVAAACAVFLVGCVITYQCSKGKTGSCAGCWCSLCCCAANSGYLSLP